jgi:hypothetical protein
VAVIFLNMVFHRNHACFERSQWRCALLFPFWASQCLFLCVIIGTLAFCVASTLKAPDLGLMTTAELM